MSTAAAPEPGSAPAKSPEAPPVVAPEAAVTAWARLRRNPTAWVGGGLVAALALLALLGEVVAGFDPMDSVLRNSLLAPGTGGHLLGTDQQGRDVLARLAAGARVSLAVGVGVSTTAGLIGVALGLLAGFRGGLLDTLIMRAADIVLAFPRLILAIGLLAVAPRPSLWLVFAVLSLTGWAGVARLARGQTLQARGLDYVLAARVAGAGEARLLLRHILPNILGVLAVWFTLAIPGAIMAEAGLSFLGLGAQPGVPSWGNMIGDARDYISYGFAYWWIPVMPGIALAAAVLGWNLLGDALQEALNPRLRDDA